MALPIYGRAFYGGAVTGPEVTRSGGHTDAQTRMTSAATSSAAAVTSGASSRRRSLVSRTLGPWSPIAACATPLRASTGAAIPHTPTWRSSTLVAHPRCPDRRQLGHHVVGSGDGPLGESVEPRQQRDLPLDRSRRVGEEHLAHRRGVHRELGTRRVIEPQWRRARGLFDHHHLVAATDPQADRLAGAGAEVVEHGFGDVVAGVLQRPLTEHRDPQPEAVLLGRRLLLDVPGHDQRPQQPMRRARREADGAGDLRQTRATVRTHRGTRAARPPARSTVCPTEGRSDPARPGTSHQQARRPSLAPGTP